ncbi:MAG: hypothetical protein AAF824_19530 [Bacteroidota bacterium]
MKEEDLAPLARIQKVDPPPFLYTRIEARLRAGMEEVVPVRWVRLALAGFVMLMLVNIWLVQNRLSYSQISGENIAVAGTEVELYLSNQLYNE